MNEIMLNTGTAMAASPVYPGSPLRVGSSGTEVSIMQSYLNAIRTQMFPSMTRITVDGVYGNATRNTVMQYQNFSGLAADGIIGRNTWNSIINDYSTLPVPPADEYPGTPLRPGSSGPAVTNLQVKLNMISPVYTAINRQTADGIYGTNMTNAVRRFQGQFGLVTDGIAGRQTWDKITSVHRGVTSNNNTSVVSSYPGYILTNGSRGDNVRFVQSYLNAINSYHNYRWPVLTVDGIYGQMTTQAVSAFQAKYALKTDGKTGPATWSRLISEFNGVL